MNAKEARRITEQAESGAVQMTLELVRQAASKGYHLVVLDDLCYIKLSDSDIKALEGLGYTITPGRQHQGGEVDNGYIWYSFPVISW